MDSFLICNNGSQIISSDGKKTIREHLLPADVAIEVYRLAVDAGLSCHIYENNIIHASKETPFSEEDHRLSGLIVDVPTTTNR